MARRALAIVLALALLSSCAFLLDTETLAGDAGTPARDATSGVEGGEAASHVEGGDDAPVLDVAMQEGPTDEAGDSGDGGKTDADSSPPSCAPGGPGMTDCAEGHDCCTSLDVSGGLFDRSYDDVTYTDPGYPANVSSFRLDKYEITVGRFRQFVNAVVAGWMPGEGAGKHLHLNNGQGLSVTTGGSEMGWEATAWNASLATTLAQWTANLSCDETQPTYQTWTDTATAGSEYKPINCVTWYEAYAFCIWDGGFLPSEAEWNYAAAGGGVDTGGQRAYPWSSPSTSTTISCEYANYYSDTDSGPKCLRTTPNNVGSYPMGDGFYEQSDLAGNLAEWTLDGDATPYFNPCVDCTNPEPASTRVVRGGNFLDKSMDLLASFRIGSAANSRSVDVGARCARVP